MKAVVSMKTSAIARLFLFLEYLNTGVFDPIYPNASFLYPMKMSENFVFLTLSRGIEMEHWTKMD